MDMERECKNRQGALIEAEFAPGVSANSRFGVHGGGQKFQSGIGHKSALPIPYCGMQEERKGESDREKRREEKKTVIRERQEGDSKSKRVAKIPVRVTGKSDALSKHRPACTCALSNAYRTAYAVFFSQDGDRRQEVSLYANKPLLSRRKFKNARERSLPRGYSKIRDCIEINCCNNNLNAGMTKNVRGRKQLSCTYARASKGFYDAE